MDRLLSPAHAELAEHAASAEKKFVFWRREFEWVLGHPAVSAVPSAGCSAELALLGGFANQFALGLDASEIARDGLACRVRRLARQLSPLVASGADCCIDVTGAIAARSAAGELTEAIAQVGFGLTEAGLHPSGLWLSSRCDDPAIAVLFALRASASLGRPGLLLRVPDDLLARLLESGPARAASESRWKALTRLTYGRRNVVPVFEDTTRPACALSAPERAGSVLPLSGFEVASETAWLTLQVDISRLRPASGLCVPMLRRLVRSGLRLADNLVDQSNWHSCRHREDAFRNRRLALQFVGIGDLVDQLGLSPRSESATNQVIRLLGLVKRMMHRESMLLAQRRGSFPALETESLVGALAQRFGSQAAASLVARLSLRHRHLLVLSPFAMLPSRAPRHRPAMYLNLLACLRSADTIATYGHGRSALLGLDDYRRLLQLSWAQARNRYKT